MADTIGVIAMGEMGSAIGAPAARARRDRHHAACRPQRRERGARRAGRGRSGLDRR